MNAIGDGPVAYANSDGLQVLLPLSDIVFDAGEPKSLTFGTDAALTAWLKVLVAQDRLRPQPLPPAATSMTVDAKRPGVNGNHIVVIVVANAANAAHLDITVRETDIYRLVWSAAATGDADFVPTMLGSATTDGTRPGLVKFSGSLPPTVEVAEAVTATVGTRSGGKTRFTVPSRTGTTPPTAFTLIARDPDATGTTPGWDISVSDVAPADKAFTLTVTWSNTVTIANTTDLAALPAKMLVAVDVNVPTGAALPAVGSYQLYGGAEETSATAATTTILASS